MSTVILLGAGASVSAGYPSANGLLPAIGAYSELTPLWNSRDAWSTWMAFRDSEQAKPLELFLQASNPEIVLSALDLFSAAQDDAARTLFQFARGQNAHPESRIFVRLQEYLANDTARAARRARQCLLLCLEYFLGDKSYDAVGHPEKRNYLREIFCDLRVGDTIITFNWDTTAEHTLGEMGIWNPTTGYGFDKSLKRNSPRSPVAVSPELLPSPVRVLKLHGSIGWKRRRMDGEQIYFDDVYLLKHLPISINGEEHPVTFTDPDFERLNHDESVIVAPTFLKAVPAGNDMQHLWFLASKALAEASHVLVWGYSLPPSDGAARVLLNPLRFRMHKEDVEVVVTDPNGEIRDRWDEFLGRQISRQGRLGDS